MDRWERSKPDFDAFTDRLNLLLRQRNARYGTKNIDGLQEVMTRIGDKVARLRDAAARGLASENDWEDLAGYASIGWLLERGLWDDREVLRRAYFAHPAPLEKTWEPTAGLVHAALMSVFAVYRPVGAFRGKLRGHASWMWETNLRNIDLCDLLVAFLPYPSMGVAAEMLYAKGKSKVVWVLTGSDASSLVQYSADRVFREISELYAAVREVNNGALPENPSPPVAKGPDGV